MSHTMIINRRTNLVVQLYGILPPIEQVDCNILSQLSKCTYLSLSTNKLEQIPSLLGMSNLTKLSLGRNEIKRIENLDSVSSTLRELWISHNHIEKLSGIENLKQLKVLYIAHNRIESWDEFDKLKKLPQLEDLLFMGNPLEKNCENIHTYYSNVIQRLPNLKILDGKRVDELVISSEDQSESVLVK